MKNRIEMDRLPVIEFVVEDESVIEKIAILDKPAIEMKGMFFSDVELKKFEFKLVKDEMKIVGPALIPNKNIYREEDGYGYFGRFTVEAIAKLVKNSKKSLGKIEFNDTHLKRKVEGFILEDYIIKDSDKNNAAHYGFDNLPVGTWFIEVQVEDKEFWEKDVKELGKFGFSIESYLGLKPVYNLFKGNSFVDRMTDNEVIELAKIITKK